ncbi:MAG: c-type cytochrome [Candidatus Poribacteria bacterium]|nr:c-type cytochrome [Candidatus Poribacteria bacterium]
MKKQHWIFGIALSSAAILILFSLNHADSQSDLVKRGKYLVDAVSACGQCHTPRKGAEFDMSMYLAGHPTNAVYPKYDFSMMRQGIFMLTAPTLTAFSGPYGTSFAANLTPHKGTGLGEWTEKMFIDAMRTGYHQGNKTNRKILPPMPIKNAYENMRDADLKAMWAYLQTIKPVKNEVSVPLNRMGRPY